jgi:hypothetical protein
MKKSIKQLLKLDANLSESKTSYSNDASIAIRKLRYVRVNVILNQLKAFLHVYKYSNWKADHISYNSYTF